MLSQNFSFGESITLDISVMLWQTDIVAGYARLSGLPVI
jgi:hypothetical protein